MNARTTIRTGRKMDTILFGTLIPIILFALVTLVFYNPLEGDFALPGRQINKAEFSTEIDSAETVVMPASIDSEIIIKG